jgi:sugar-specific transcriptional regulator TrmB
MAPDLAPFGFTSTENAAYGALLGLGPSSAYSVARRLAIARANAYQALDGLVSKGAALLVGTGPKRYRATQPAALLALLTEVQARKLDRLQEQIAADTTDGDRPLITLTGTRAVRDTANRAILRARGPVRCLGTAEDLEALAPAIRARAAGGREIAVWVVGPGPVPAMTVAGAVPEDRVARSLGTVPLLLLGDGALAATRAEGDVLTGYWGSDPLFLGLIAAALAALTTE